MSINTRLDSCPNPQNLSDLSSTKHSIYSAQAHRPKKVHVKTLQISTQVNMNEQFPQLQQQKRKKREKKKQYKRRKRQQKKDEEKQAQDILAQIITSIYQGETSFRKSRTEIQNCLRWLVPGQKFHTFLNQVIRIHVKNIQNEMWKFMQETIQQSPFEKPEKDQEFYRTMIDRIYNEFQKLQISSKEIEEIINLYMLLKQNKQKADHYDLDKSTFCYFIESDQTIKNMIKICENKLLTKYQKHMRKLNLICQMMNSDDQDDEEYSYDDDPEWQTERSTSIDEEQQSQEKSGNKKRRKHKKSEFSLKVLDVIKRIRETVIVKQNQIRSFLTEEWAQSLVQKLRSVED